MADEPENDTLRLLQEIRAEMREGFEKAAAETARVHADLAAAIRHNAKVSKVHAEVLATKSLVLDVVVKLTALERRVSALEDAPAS